MVAVPDPGAAIVELGLKVMYTLRPPPEAERLMAESKPPEIAVVIVELPVVPLRTLTDVGDALMPKSGCPPVVVTVNEKLVVCDVFDAADNVSQSGLGDRDVFMRHMREAFSDLSFLRVHAQPSVSLSAETVGHDYRLVHVDGGHAARECLADLYLAASLIGPEGAIVVDDPFRPDWPGVTRASDQFRMAGMWST